LVAASNWISDDRTAAVWTSTDGLNWERVPHDNALFGDSTITSVPQQAGAWSPWAWTAHLGDHCRGVGEPTPGG